MRKGWLVALEEALYVVQFGDVAGGTYRNGGVVVLETGQVFGGDSGHYYLGKYEVRDNKITAEVKVVNYDPGITTVWMDTATEFTVLILGDVTREGVVGHMTRAEAPSVHLPVRMLLKELLP
jgi:hypothetical protein